MRKQKLYIVLSIVILAIGITYVPKKQKEENEKSKMLEIYAVKKKAIQNYLYERGIVEAKSKETILSPVDGEIVWVVEEGKQIQKGEKIIQFDDQILKMELDGILNQIKMVERALAASQREHLNHQKISVLQIEKRKLEVELAQNDLKKTQTPKTKNEMEMYKLEMEMAEQNFQFARDEHKRIQDLRRRKGASAEDIITAKQTMDRTLAQYTKAKAIHKSVVRGTNRRRLNYLRMKVTSAKQKVERDKKNFEESIKVYKENVEIQRAKLRQLKENEKLICQKIALCEIKAPVSGKIMYIRVWKGKDKNMEGISKGETRWRNAELLQIADMRFLCVHFPVNQADIHKIKSKTKAQIQLISNPKEKFTGKVYKIRKVAQDKNAYLGSLALEKYGKADISVSEVIVDIQHNSNSSIRPGLTAKVKLQIEEKKDILSIPIEYLKCQGKKYWVLLQEKPGKFQLKEVKIGISNEHYVEITKGLNPGDKIARIKGEENGKK